MSELRTPVGRPPLRRLLSVGALGAGLGLIVTLVALGLARTSRDDALAATQALVPPGADASPVGEFDPPFWYGGIYTITQEFTGGANDREGLAAAMLAHLEYAGWQIDGTEERPGATVVHATVRDLVSRSSLRGPPSTPDTEGVIQVRYAARDDLLVLGAGALGGAAALAGAAMIVRSRAMGRT